MSDLVERLRTGDATWELNEHAADEIERLEASRHEYRATITKLNDEIERLRAALERYKALVDKALDEGYLPNEFVREALQDGES